MKKARLGRGLDALLGDSRPPAAAAPAPVAPDADILRQLPVEALRRGRYQPRAHMNQAALAELAESIKAQGVVQPILVREIGAGEYEIVAGERRWRAAQLAGLGSVPAVVRKVPDRAAMAVALIENIQREDLNPVEEANGLQRLLDEFGLTHQEVADAIGRSRAGVTNLLRLLTLHVKVREHLEEGRLDMGHARALLALPGDAQPAAAQTVVSDGLSVRQTEQLVKRLNSAASNESSRATDRPARSADVARLEQDLSERLGAEVAIAHRSSGGGRISIAYHSLDELDGILERIR